MWYIIGSRASDFFDYYLGGEGYVCGWSNKAKSAYGVGSAVRWDLGKWGSFALHSNGDNRDGSVADVARLPRAVFLRGDKSEVESNGRRGETPTYLCYRGVDCEAAREGSDLVISLCQMECGVVAALQRRVPHCDVLLGAVRSVLSWVPVVVRSRREVWTTARE